MRLNQLQNKFPYLSIYESTEWYNRIFKNSNDVDCENMCNLLYGSLHSRFEDTDSTYLAYYMSFLNGLDDTMYYFMRLCDDKFNPYANVHEETSEKTENPNTKQTVTNGARTDSSLPVTDSVTTGNTTSTSENFEVPTNTTNERETSKNINTVNGKTDTTNLGARSSTTGEQTITTENDANDVKFTRLREGNIGVTTNGQLFEDTTSVASKMRLVELFLNEYIQYFSEGWFE